MEEFHSKLGVIADLSALEMRAPATAQMTAKGIKQAEIDVFQNSAFPLQEAAEMGGGANVPNGTCWRVSLAFKVICERIDVRSTDSTAQTP